MFCYSFGNAVYLYSECQESCSGNGKSASVCKDNTYYVSAVTESESEKVWPTTKCSFHQVHNVVS